MSLRCMRVPWITFLPSNQIINPGLESYTRYNHCERWHGTVSKFGKQTLATAFTKNSVRNEMLVKHLCPIPPHIWVSLTLTFDLLTWISTHQGLYTYTSRTIYLQSLKLLGQIWIMTNQWTSIPNDQHVQSNMPSFFDGGIYNWNNWKTGILIPVPTLKYMFNNLK